MNNIKHPLEYIALDLIEIKKEIDTWDLAAALGTTNEFKVMKHYNWVAADILETLYHTKQVIRRGNGNPKKPELGSFFYSKPLS